MGRGSLTPRVLILLIVIAAVVGVAFVSLKGVSLAPVSKLIQQIIPKERATTRPTEKKTPEQAKQTVDAAAREPTLALGTRAQFGCLVCHSDRNAIGVIDGKAKSIFVDEAQFRNSPHESLSCLSCHLDFSYSHPVEVANYKKTAGLSCTRCHTHNKQTLVYRSSIHGRLALSDDPKGGATCGDCHGGHNIRSLKKDSVYRASFRASAEKVCGKCHSKYYDSYNDYYHGRAYKREAADAPTCWDCHDSHDVFPKKENRSSVSAVNLAKTCGRCHKGSTKKFTEYALLVHGRKQVEETNFVLRYKNLASEWIGQVSKPSLGGRVSGTVKRSLEEVRSWFFPESLRPKKD